MQKAFYNIWVPLEMGDIIQGQKYTTQYEVLDIQHTYSIKEKNVIDVSLCLKSVVTGVESKVPYDFDTWKIIKENNK